MSMVSITSTQSLNVSCSEAFASLARMHRSAPIFASKVFRKFSFVKCEVVPRSKQLLIIRDRAQSWKDLLAGSFEPRISEQIVSSQSQGRKL